MSKRSEITLEELLNSDEASKFFIRMSSWRDGFLYANYNPITKYFDLFNILDSRSIKISPVWNGKNISIEKFLDTYKDDKEFYIIRKEKVTVEI